MLAQVKVVGDIDGVEVNKATDQQSAPGPRKPKRTTRRRQPQHGQGRECDSCGYRHAGNRESCAAQGKECLNCGKLNHFASKCRQEVNVTEEAEPESEEMYQTEEISALKLDDSQLVTLKLESSSFIRFQPDTGPQCKYCHYTFTKVPPRIVISRRYNP